MANTPRRFRVHFSHAPAWNMRARQEVLIVAAESTQAVEDTIRTTYQDVRIGMIEDFPADERMVPPEQRWRVGLTQSGSVPATHKNVEVQAVSHPKAVYEAVSSNLGWHFNGFAEQLDDSKPYVMDVDDSNAKQPGGQKSGESEPAKPSEECAQAELSEEDQQRWLQRTADKADIIELILSYRNPADDETKLRQIRVVMD